MTGWRIGFAAGHPDVVKALGKVKTNIDSGAAQAIQMGALHALRGSQECVEGMTRVYQKRRNIMVEGLRAAGLEVDLPRATFYLWVQTPSGLSSADFSAKLLDEAGVVTTPGNGFGGAGEGYIRIALTVADEKLQEAVQRIKKVL
jgi:LL-diaminopimelate aminotransferase